MPAPLNPLPINMPTFRGLNTELGDAITSPEWAVELDNLVFDKAGRLAARKGWAKIHSTEIAESSVAQYVRTIHAYGDSTQTDLISHAGTKFYLGSSELVDVTGTATAPEATDEWKFQNYNNKALGFCDGKTPVVFNGSTFSDLSATHSGAMPTTWSGVSLAAYGRIWVADATKTVVKYSALLDETDWNDLGLSASDSDAGYIDLTSVWKGGYDEITAIESFNGQLIIFCKNSIIVYGKPEYPVTEMTLIENMHGVGCIARDSVQVIGKDLWFLSLSGIRSLGRTLVQDKMPLSDVSKNIHTLMTTITSGLTATQSVKSVYSEKNAFYLITFPSVGITFCFDLKGALEDGAYRVTTWSSINPRALSVGFNGIVYMGFEGWIGRYDGYLDNESTYDVSMHSTWFNVGENRINILKTIKVYLYTGANITFETRWKFDFKVDDKTSSKAITVTAIGSEYGIAEFGIAEYGGSVEWKILTVPASGNGNFFRYGFGATINGSELAVQKIDLFTKLGRVN